MEEIKIKLASKLMRSKLSFENYKLFAEYLRKEMSKSVLFDRDKVRKAAERIVEETKTAFGDVNYEYQQKLRGLIKSIVIMNAVFRSKTAMPARYKAGKDDYDTFETIFRRLTEDHFKLMMKPSGIQRHGLSTGSVPGHPGQTKIVR
jgi:hypothetical protein